MRSRLLAEIRPRLLAPRRQEMLARLAWIG
jgi:hypothetical protein